MIIQQDSMDDAVLQLRITSILRYVGGMLQDRKPSELPAFLRDVRDFVVGHTDPVFPGLDVDGNGVRFHTYYILEVLSAEVCDGVVLRDLPYLVDSENSPCAGCLTQSPTTPVPPPVMSELLMDIGSDPGYLK